MKVYSLKWAAALVALQAAFGTSAYAATPTNNLFSDTSYVTSDKMAAIQEAVRQGLLSGDPHGTFRPAATLTRQELAVLLVRALKLDPISSSSTFKDVQSKQFAAPYIEAAQKAGFLSGDGLGNFRPNDPVTREELAAVFVRAVGGVNTEGGSSILPKDQSLVSQWAAGSVDTALRLGLIDIHDSKLNPTGEVKREDIAPFLLDIFKTQEQTATINSIDGDIVTIDNVPYLIEGNLKELIGNSNKDALKGAKLKFNSRNRNVDGLQQLEIVQKDVVLNTNGLPESSLLRILGDGVQIKGDIKGVIELNDGVSNIQLNGNVNHLNVNSGNGISIKGTGTIGELQVANANAKVTLNPNFKVETIKLPKDASVSQVIQNYSEVQKQIGQIQSADGTVQETTTITSSSVKFSSGGGKTTSTNSVTNHAPGVTTGFTDITLSTADEPKKINLANSFTDADGDTLTYTAETSATNVATVSVNGSQLTLTPMNAGTATITVTANDGKAGTINSQFNVTVTPVIPEAVNHAPTVQTSISNVTTGAADGVKTVSLASVFADEDSDALTYTATSTDTGVSTVAVNGSDLKIMPVNAGTVTITVTADDGKGGTVDTQFNVTITPVIPEAVNHAPTVETSISNVTTGAADGVKTVSLASVFADEDSDALTYTATSTDTGVATAAVNGSDLKITPVNAGTVTITVTADDGKGGTVDTQFNVTITPVIPEAVNHAPTVDTSISNVTIGAADGVKTVSLASVFADEDSDALMYTVTSTDTGVATAAVNGSDLKITPVNAGTVTITVTADDGKGGTVDTQFNVTITPVIPEAVNHAPTVDTSISNVTIGAADGVKTVSLASVFADEDSDALMYTATSTDTGVATAAVNGSDLKITPVNAGTVTITVTADDGNGGTVDTNFTLTVTPPPAANHAPVVQSTINDVSTEAGAVDTTIGLASTFADEDLDLLTYSADSSDPSVLTVSVTGDQLSITPLAVGSATVTVTADDGKGGTVQTIFQVTAGEKKGLFFSELAWGESDSMMQIIELYNVGSEELDASKIRIERSDSGNSIEISQDAGAFIPGGATFVIGDTMYFGDAHVDYFTDMGFYNDDSAPVTLSLYYDNQLIDTAVFQPHTTLARQSDVTHGNADYEASEWFDEGTDYTDNIGIFSSEAP
ncbi:S-layer homology domain-containing protein [Paenibacillus polymyxa]|uniref:Ig-like domain-containing protein n=1 Tax=Paenibacillus polymyxa TaxID=1406 RepID=UPI002AB4384C|nr:S-layer homology domain-containing protein [Paenibacillus polymyxa]MDY8048264.1 S-layer homology domain-containing protein [Paenibacillus polymyxa]